MGHRTARPSRCSSDLIHLVPCSPEYNSTGGSHVHIAEINRMLRSPQQGKTPTSATKATPPDVSRIHRQRSSTPATTGCDAISDRSPLRHSGSTAPTRFRGTEQGVSSASSVPSDMPFATARRTTHRPTINPRRDCRKWVRRVSCPWPRLLHRHSGDPYCSSGRTK